VTVQCGSLERDLPNEVLAEETLDTLFAARGAVRIERIVSTGQATPDGTWCDQASDEWVLLAAGAARLRIECETQDRELAAGDWILLPAHCRHRVTWTQSQPPAVWLAVHVFTDD
jgi:cupin 2 domain-containing protein